MKRITSIRLAFLFALSVFAVGPLSVAHAATPAVNGASIELRTFNDCPISTLSSTNNYPALVSITDVMDGGCGGFANLHSFSFSEDGGTTAAVFDNNTNYRFAADFSISGAGQGEGGLRISPWYGKFVDGRFMCNVTTGEIACFGGALPFYSFTGNHGITYVRGSTIHLEVTYRARDLFSTDPATMQYVVTYNGNTYDSGPQAFGQQNPNECDPYSLWGSLNDGRAGGYFQPRANTGASLTATWSNITFEELAQVGTPVANGAVLNLRTFNDCPISTLTSDNSYPATIKITDVMDPGCGGFANLHGWSFSEDGGGTAANFHNNSDFHYFADYQADGASGQGEGGLRISPWYGQNVDGRFMANATSGEIACFGGALPFYSFTGNHGITYTRGTPIRLDVRYRSYSETAGKPATIQYVATYNGNTYSSGQLPFGEQNANECNPHGLWGMLNEGRVGGYFQPRANTGASLSNTWNNIRYSTCPDPIAATGKISPKDLNLKSKAKWVTVEITPAAPHNASEIDIASLRLNGVPAATDPAPKIEDHGKRLKVRFSRPAVQETVTPGNSVPALVTGNVGGDCFELIQNLKVKAPHMTAPAPNSVLAPGSIANVGWEIPEDMVVSSVTLLVSYDDGVTWEVVQQNLPNTGSYNWHVPDVQTPNARLQVVLMVTEDETGPVNESEYAETERFSIGSALAVGPNALELALVGAVPNPSRQLDVSFTLPSNQKATLTVYDVTGRQVSTREVGSLGAGPHRVSLASGGRLPAGIYMVQLVQGPRRLSSRAIVVK